MSAVTDIATYITTLGISGLTVLDGAAGAGVFRNEIPDAPDHCAVVRGYGGRPPEGQLGVPGLKWEYPGIQVICRGVAYDYATPESDARTIFLALGQRGLGITFTSGHEYLMIDPVQNPFPLGGKDDNNRIVIASNYIITKATS
jgi:hypothetical protein